MAKLIYRGYETEPHSKEGFVIKQNGVTICSQPSMEFAQSWIDRTKKEQFMEAQRLKGVST